MTEKQRLVAYVSGPYRGAHASEIVENIRKAREVALQLWKLGYVVICPHSNTALFDGALGIKDETWLEGGLELRRRSDLVVLLPEWRRSRGAFLERAEALSRSIPVYEWAQRFDVDTLRELARAWREAQQ